MEDPTKKLAYISGVLSRLKLFSTSQIFGHLSATALQTQDSFQLYLCGWHICVERP